MSGIIETYGREIQIALDLGIVLIWLVYLQLFFGLYFRQTRAKIIINSGAGKSLGAHCFICNMSSDPIYVQSIILDVVAQGRPRSASVTDIHELTDDEQDADARSSTLQGPLGRGEFMDIGSFRRLLRRADALATSEPGETATDQTDDQPTLSDTLTVTVVASYASEDLMVGAQRRFEIRASGGRRTLHPTTVDTRQIRQRSRRRYLHDQLRQYL